jgi:putative transposase
MPKTYTNLLTHIIFSTKERLPLIDDEIKPRLHAYMGGIIREVGGVALIIGGIKIPRSSFNIFAADTCFV